MASCAARRSPTSTLLILHSFGEDVLVADLDDETKFTAQLIVLAALVSDEQLDDDGLDAFLSEAREIADDLLQKDG